MKGIRCLGWFLLMASVALGAGQSMIAPRRSHDIWNRGTGFPGGYIYAITQTTDGYLWIATSKGLFRYDGLSFAFIQNGDSNAAMNVIGLVADSTDQLWATDDHTHLFQYGGGLLNGPIPDNGRHQYLPSAVNKTVDGSLLFLSELQGLVEYKQGKRRVLLEPGLVPNSPTAVAQTADGSIWIAAREAGLFRLDEEKGGARLRQVSGLANTKINCLLPIANSTLLIGTNNGLLSLNNDNLSTEISLQLEHREILALGGGQQGDVWIGTSGSVFKAHAKDIHPESRILSLEKLVVSGNATALFEDRDGNLWVGEPEAIERYRDSAFSSYLNSAGLPCANCGAIYIDRQGSVWFAPWDGGLFRIADGELKSIEVDGLKEDIVYSMVGDEDEVWAARRYGGLTRLRLQGDAVQASTYSRQNGLAQDAVYSVYRESNGTVWAGTLNGGLSRFRGWVWHTFTTKDGLPSNTISAIAGNSAGEIFVGTPTGLAELKNDQWIRYNTHDGLPPGPIESLFWGENDTLWIGTAKGVAFLRSGAVHVPLGAPNALYGDILGIAENNGWLWITTPDHVLRVKCTALLMGLFAEGDYREFGVADGLASVAGVRRPNSIRLDNQGNLWFSLDHGISVMQPKAFAGPTFPVTVRVDGLLVDGRAVDAGGPIHVPSGRHRLTFQYTGVNVSNPEGVRYRYRLYDVDSAWSQPTALREIDFTNTPPGQFQFQVAASSPDGVWSTSAAAIAFEVEPSLLQTRWFQVASIVILMLLAFAVYQLRVQQLHRRFNIGFEARVNERTRIARDLHDTLLQTLHGLMFQFQAVRNLMPRKPDEAMRSLDDAIDETEKALAQSRDAIQGLRSEPIATGNLADLLTDASKKLVGGRTANQELPAFDLVEEGERRRLSPAANNEVCRIALELLTNAFRHAHATRIETEIRYDNQVLRVRIRDNGKGIDPKVLNAGGVAGHWGLRGVRERAERISARLDFWSEAGAGTEVELAVPAAVAYETKGDGAGWSLRRKENHRAERS